MIPSWNSVGVLPPIKPGQPGHSIERSPYRTSIIDFIDNFSSTKDRVDILEGFLDYRNALHKLGVTKGFQWLDGSFLENIETLESRSPRDIDVVTYFHLPPGETQATLDAKAGNLFDHNHVKATYKVDAYTIVLGKPFDNNQVRQVSYWYSMWSHRRTDQWKGFVQIDLNSNHDNDARQLLLASPLRGAP